MDRILWTLQKKNYTRNTFMVYLWDRQDVVHLEQIRTNQTVLIYTIQTAELYNTQINHLNVMLVKQDPHYDTGK